MYTAGDVDLFLLIHEFYIHLRSLVQYIHLLLLLARVLFKLHQNSSSLADILKIVSKEFINIFRVILTPSL